MWRRMALTAITLIVAVILTLPMWERQKLVAPGFSPALEFVHFLGSV